MEPTLLPRASSAFSEFNQEFGVQFPVSPLRGRSFVPALQVVGPEIDVHPHVGERNQNVGYAYADHESAFAHE